MFNVSKLGAKLKSFLALTVNESQSNVRSPPKAVLSTKPFVSAWFPVHSVGLFPSVSCHEFKFSHVEFSAKEYIEQNPVTGSVISGTVIRMSFVKAGVFILCVLVFVVISCSVYGPR